MVGERRRLRRRRGVGRGVARVAAPFVVVAALVVLAVGAVAQIGPASGPDRRTVDRSYAVLAAPVVADSNAEGSAVKNILVKGPTLSRTTFFDDLSSITTTAAQDARQFAALSPPTPEGDVAEQCGSAMNDRLHATIRIRDALDGLLGGRRGLGGGDEAAATRTLVGVGTMLESADVSWNACRRTLRRAAGAARLPVSRWITDPGLWSEGALGPFSAALVSSASLMPVHRLTLLAVSTDPAAVPDASGVGVLPPTNALHVMIVVADQGNVDEPGVRLAVTAVPPGTVRAPAPAGARADIDAGRSVALSPPPLSVRAGTSYVLHITVTPQEAGASVSTSLSLRVSAEPPPPTTTTTVAASTSPSTTVRSG